MISSWISKSVYLNISQYLVDSNCNTEIKDDMTSCIKTIYQLKILLFISSVNDSLITKQF